MNISEQEYARMAKQASRNSKTALNTLKAFAVGGTICLLGQALIEVFTLFGADEETAPTLCSLTLIAVSVVLTALGRYEKIAKQAGAGTLVPITGFANSVAAPAIEYKTEGYILGVGTKIFSIAGPVIVYGTAAGVIYGILYAISRAIA